MGRTMTDKTESQSEALELADRLIGNAQIDECEGCNPVVVALERAAAAELRRLHAEIQQLKVQLSARQAAPDGWMQGARYSLEAVAYVGSECWTNDGMRAVCIKKAADRIVAEHDRLLAAPPSHEREPLSKQQVSKIALDLLMTNCTWHALQNTGFFHEIVPFTVEIVAAAERAHGIGATND